MITMGLDQSYKKSGIVILEDTNMIHYEVFSTTDKSDDRYEQSYILSQHIKAVVEEWKPEKMAIEGLAFGSRGNVTRDLAGLQYATIIQLRHAACKVRPEIGIIAATTLKKFATGSGKAKKEDVIASLPINIKTQFDLIAKKTTGLDDLADAYYLAQMAITV